MGLVVQKLPLNIFAMRGTQSVGNYRVQRMTSQRIIGFPLNKQGSFK